MGIAYEKDIVAWANEQASFIRAGRFDLLDLENIAEEIEDVGKSEKRELASRMAVLIEEPAAQRQAALLHGLRDGAHGLSVEYTKVCCPPNVTPALPA